MRGLCLYSFKIYSAGRKKDTDGFALTARSGGGAGRERQSVFADLKVAAGKAYPVALRLERTPLSQSKHPDFRWASQKLTGLV